MGLTKKQKKELQWAKAIDDICGKGKNKGTDTSRQIRRRVKNIEMKKGQTKDAK